MLRTLGTLTLLTCWICFSPIAWAQLELQQIPPEFPTSSGSFGLSIASTETTLVIGEPSGEFNRGAVTVLSLSQAQWEQQQRLTASDGMFGDAFGASVDVFKDTIVASALERDGAFLQAGAVYVFQRQAGRWEEIQILTASDADFDDSFGASVSIFGDWLAVGAFKDTHSGVDDAGSVYLFRRNDGVWTEHSKVVADPPMYQDVFGGDVDLLESTLIVGANRDDERAQDAGAVYVFGLIDDVWVLQQKLLASDAAAADEFGFCVALSEQVIVVGSPGSSEAGPLTGSAYIFENDGLAWVEQQKLAAPLPAPGSTFGNKVSISAGTVGIAERGNGEVLFEAGACRLYHSIDDHWTIVSELRPDVSEAQEWFGYGLSVSGLHTFVGSPRHGADGSGLAYVFPVPDGRAFRRGDSNLDGATNLADAIFDLTYLFFGGPSFCLDSQDSNDDGAVDCADPVYLLSHLFLSGPPPPLASYCIGDQTPDDVDCSSAECE